jgi:hypothetical protein
LSQQIAKYVGEHGGQGSDWSYLTWAEIGTEHIITLVGLIHLEFGRALGLILPLTIDSVFSFVCRTIQSNPK